MQYWRDEYFRDLKDAAAGAKADGWLKFADYCSDQERGLRSSAFASLAQFIDGLQHASNSERIRFVSWILEFAHERSGRHLLIPHPLEKQIVEPCLHEWVMTEPENATPHRWIGSRDHLERALELDPSDQIARKKLIIGLLSWIDYATHELPRGYLGSVTEDLQTLDTIESLLPGLLDERLRLDYAAVVAEERAGIEKYLSRLGSDPASSR